MGGTFGSRYAEAAARLLGSSPPAGTTDRTLAMAERRLGVKVPDALREYYDALGGLTELNRAHNRLLAPKDWFLDAGRLVFMEENQVVLCWGVEASNTPGVDPPVFQGVNLHPEPLEWHPECDTASEFLVVSLYWQAVMGGLDCLGTADCPDGLAGRLSPGWSRVGSYSGVEAFGRNGMAVCLPTEGDPALYVAARTEPLYAARSDELAALGVELERL